MRLRRRRRCCFADEIQLLWSFADNGHTLVPDDTLAKQIGDHKGTTSPTTTQRVVPRDGDDHHSIYRAPPLPPQPSPQALEGTLVSQPATCSSTVFRRISISQSMGDFPAAVLLDDEYSRYLTRGLPASSGSSSPANVEVAGTLAASLFQGMTTSQYYQQHQWVGEVDEMFVASLGLSEQTITDIAAFYTSAAYAALRHRILSEEPGLALTASNVFRRKLVDVIIHMVQPRAAVDGHSP
jgi:hypothetical protein